MKYTKEKTIVGLGVVLVLLPLSGFPRDWKTVLSVIIGVCVIYVGLLFFRIAKRNAHKNSETTEEVKTQTFTETV